MANQRVSTETIARVLIKEIDSLKETVKEVKELQEKGLEVNQTPLFDFLEEYQKITEKNKRKIYLPKSLVYGGLILLFISLLISCIELKVLYDIFFTTVR